MTNVGDLDINLFKNLTLSERKENPQKDQKVNNIEEIAKNLNVKLKNKKRVLSQISYFFESLDYSGSLNKIAENKPQSTQTLGKY